MAKKLTSRIEKQNYGGLACRRSAALLIFALFSHTLGAYNIGPVPIAWLSTVFFIISPIPIIFSRKFHIPPSLNNIIIYLVCGIISLFIYDILYSPPPMPPLASTSYAVYLILRIATVISYIAALFTSYNLVLNGMSYLILRSNVYLLGIVTVLGIYIYLAQRYGFWEPPRTRRVLGDRTLHWKGWSSVLIHRLGTFRERSILPTGFPQRSSFTSQKIFSERSGISFSY